MAEYLSPENMGCKSNYKAGDWSSKSDHSFVVDMDHRFSHLTQKEIIANSRIGLQRNLSRKGSSDKGDEKKINSTTHNGTETDSSKLPTSPKANFHGGSTPEKPAVVALGATDHSIFIPQIHHQNTTTSDGAAAAGNKYGGKRFSFRRSSPAWIIDPRRILLLFASLSSMGTILLIYFTLSMSKLNGDDISLNI